MGHGFVENHLGKIEAAFAGKPAWHDLGTVLKDATNSKEMEFQSGLGWRIGLEELRTESGIIVPDHFATVRKDNGRILGVVGKRYTPVQNHEAFEFLDSLTSTREMLYESAGALFGGKTVFVLARLPSVDTIAEGDNSLRYVLFSTSHDGSGSIHAIPTSVRVVCANTLRIATAGAVGIRHTSNVKDRLAEARLLLSQYDRQFDLYRDKAQLLAQRKISPEDAKAFILELFPEVKEEGRAKTIREETVQRIRDSWRNVRNNFSAIRGTWWQALNAVTEVIDHDDRKAGGVWRKPEKRETRFLSLMNGSGADTKAKALRLALTISGIGAGTGAA